MRIEEGGCWDKMEDGGCWERMEGERLSNEKRKVSWGYKIRRRVLGEIGRGRTWLGENRSGRMVRRK